MKLTTTLTALLPFFFHVLTTTATPAPAPATGSSTLLSKRGNCHGSGDIYDSECVTVYSGSDCATNGVETSYRPTCAGNCYVYGFDSLKVQGSAYYGTNCVAYSDTNCQDEIGQSGNQYSGDCSTFEGGQSMKCYYDC